MKTVCHYAIVRFTPFVETGEYANVGVLLFAPDGRYFGFKLLTNRYARVTNFFEEMDAQVFRASMTILREELTRISALFKGMGLDRRHKSFDRSQAFLLWGEVTKHRETMLTFSEPRVALSDDVTAKLLSLYQFYVERNFVTKEYQEKLLERVVRGWLREVNLDTKFLPARVGNDDYHAQFPFVYSEGNIPTKVIKPLNLGYSDPARIIDHGGQWIVRIKALKKRDLLPASVLFATDISESDVESSEPHALMGNYRNGIGNKLWPQATLGSMATNYPSPAATTLLGQRVENDVDVAFVTSKKVRLINAQKDVIQELEANGVLVVPYKARQRVIEFATGKLAHYGIY